MEINYEEVLKRLQYFRNKNHLSARETSLRLGLSESFMNRIERNAIELKVSTLLNFMELIGITPQEFFYSKPEHYKADKELLEQICKLSFESKESLKKLIKNMK